MRGVLRTVRGRDERAELTQSGFLGLPTDREMYFFVEGAPEGTIQTTARPVLNSKTWLFSFRSRVLVRLRVGCGQRKEVCYCLCRAEFFVIDGHENICRAHEYRFHVKKLSIAAYWF